MVWSVILKLETGENRISTHPTISLDAEESKTKILGSLASRWAKGPVKPTSKFPQEPIFLEEASSNNSRCRESDEKVFEIGGEELRCCHAFY
jgi:hypothetical protein